MQGSNTVGAFMQLDFKKDVSISSIVLWNLMQSGQGIRMIGCTLSVVSNSGITVFSHSLNTVQVVYDWEFGPRPRMMFRKTMGPIRSVLGKCIDVPVNSGSGARIYVFDCHGGNNQQWGRPTSIDSDLRLQANQTNFCVDVGTGGAVITSTCNATRDSQQWMYDGRNLRPKYNTGLCLTIEGGISINKAWLIVSNCDNGSGSAWVEYSISSVIGGWNGNNTNHFLCPVGSKVINIGFNLINSVMDRFSMACDDTNDIVIGPSVNGTFSTPCLGGYTAMNVTVNDTYVRQINTFCASSKSWVTHGVAGGTQNGTNPLILWSDQRVIGMQLTYGVNGSYVTKFTILYSTGSSWQQTISPIIFPTMRPTSKPSRRPTTLS